MRFNVGDKVVFRSANTIFDQSYEVYHGVIVDVRTGSGYGSRGICYHVRGGVYNPNQLWKIYYPELLALEDGK